MVLIWPCLKIAPRRHMVFKIFQMPLHSTILWILEEFIDFCFKCLVINISLDKEKKKIEKLFLKIWTFFAYLNALLNSELGT